MLEEYRALIGEIYRGAFWLLTIASFYFCKDANVRWTLFIIGGFSIFTEVIVAFVMPVIFAVVKWGWIYHVIQIFIYVALIKSLIIFRPLITLKIGNLIAKIPVIGYWINMVLPARYKAKIFMAELAMRRICYAFVFSHSLVICHYIMFAFGAFEPGALYEMIGLYQLALWDLALAVHSVGLTLELLLLLALTIAGCKKRFFLKV